MYLQFIAESVNTVTFLILSQASSCLVARPVFATLFNSSGIQQFHILINNSNMDNLRSIKEILELQEKYVALTL